MGHRSAKIVATIGPAVDTEEALRELIESGIDVARLNFSHGTHEGHRAVAARIRKASQELGKPIALLQDLCGPKIRTGKMGPAAVAVGETVYLREGPVGTADTIAVDYQGLAEDVRIGDRVLLGDGAVELEVIAIVDHRVQVDVLHGGALRERMGVNLPSKRIRVSALTPKDKLDLLVGLELDVDYLALSFVRSADDVKELRALCEERGKPTPIIAKIETPEAVENIEAIVQASDAIMVARGDLGVEFPPELVPTIQKELIGTARKYQRPVIVATEMLQSMVESPRPTRAEASDVANAIFDGADAVMLSAETATGAHPNRVVRMMSRIIQAAEKSPFYKAMPSPNQDSTAEAIASASVEVAATVKAAVLVALTNSGSTARLISKARPRTPILALSPEVKTLARLALYWGVTPRYFEVETDVDHLVARLGEFLERNRWANVGERFVMTYGAPVGVRGNTSAIRVEKVR